MQKLSTRLLVMLFVVTLLAAGCAKKPVAEEAATSAEMQETTMTEQEPAAEPAAAVVEEKVTTAADVAAGLVRVHFDFDQYVLTDAAKETLANNAMLLKAAPAVMIKIEGHCDERGSDEYNMALGEKRALATKDYLVSLGVDAGRMSTISYGEEMPLDPASNETAWAKNRRADFKVQ